MAANLFNLLNGVNVYSQKDFFHEEKQSSWSSINYFNDYLGTQNKRKTKIKGKTFHCVSFKDTVIQNVIFSDCHFYDCLLLGSTLDNCEIINCRFHGTNTYKIKIQNSLIDPKQFRDNFELKYDANIAVDLFQELYKNSKNEEQPQYANESLFRMREAEGYNLDHKYMEDKISLSTFLYKKSLDFIAKYCFGYGLKISRIMITVLIIMLLMSCLNFSFKNEFSTEQEIKDFLDAIYFTCITITTLGYGDITPTSPTTKLIVIVESLVGFLFMSLFVSAFVNRILRS